MSFFDPQNPGIGGLDELTPAEELFLTTLAGLTGDEGDVLTWIGGAPSWEASSGSGANTALSNLSSVAINTSLLSDTTKTDDLGSSSIKWKDLWTQNVYADTIGYNSLRSVFGERSIFINEFTDALWRANWRFTVTRSGTGTIASLFDAGFETTYVVPVSTTDVININMANQSGVPSAGVTYPEGKLYVHFYYTNHQYSSISARVKQNGIWYTLSAPTDISTSSVDKVLEFSIPSNNYMTDIELTVATDGSNPVWITGVNYIPLRWTSELESPFLDKNLSTNTLIGNTINFKNSANTITASINANDDWYMGVGGSGGKFGIGTSTPGTYRLNVVGNILGNDIVTNSGSVFQSLGVAYLRASSTNPIHIGDASAQPIDLGKGGGAVAINTDYSNIPIGTKLQVNAGSATSSSTILKLYGSSTGFSGANDAGTAYALSFDGTSYQTSIKQSVGAKIEMAKENTWNYADTPTGIKGSLKFYTSAGTPDSPTLTNWMTLTSAGNLGLGSGITPLTKLDARYDANINTTTPGTTAYGTIHLVPTTGTDGYSTGISFGTNNSGSVSTTSQAGLYVQGSSGYGTRMHFATSNNFGTGATVRMSISEGGNITMTGSLGITGTRVSKGWFTDLESTNMPTVGGTSLSSLFQGLDTQLTSLAGLSYTGNGGKFLRVNAGETDFELATISGGGDALTSNPLSQFASTTSAQLAGVISDETGSGLLVFNDTPTLTTPVLLGTPNATGELGRDTTQKQLNYYDDGLLGTIPRVLQISRPNESLTNSTASDQDFSSLFTIPANYLIANKAIRVSILYQLVTGSSSVTITQYMKLGSTKVASAVAQDVTSSATRSIMATYTFFGTTAAGGSANVDTGSAAPFTNGSGNGVNTVAQPVALATNGSLNIVPGVTWSGTGSTETLTILSVTIEALN